MYIFIGTQILFNRIGSRLLLLCIQNLNISIVYRFVTFLRPRIESGFQIRSGDWINQIRPIDSIQSRSLPNSIFGRRTVTNLTAFIGWYDFIHFKTSFRFQNPISFVQTRIVFYQPQVKQFTKYYDVIIYDVIL